MITYGQLRFIKTAQSFKTVIVPKAEIFMRYSFSSDKLQSIIKQKRMNLSLKPSKFSQ